MLTSSTRSNASPDIARERRAARGDAGVGDDDVEAAEALDRLGDGALHRAAVGHVGGEAERAVAEQRGGRRSRGVRSRSTTTTIAPRRASAFAVAKPIPRAPPVTSATLPLSSNRCAIAVTVPLPGRRAQVRAA